MRPLLRFPNILACKFVDALAPDRAKGVYILGSNGFFPFSLRRIAAQLITDIVIGTVKCADILGSFCLGGIKSDNGRNRMAAGSAAGDYAVIAKGLQRFRYVLGGDLHARPCADLGIVRLAERRAVHGVGVFQLHIGRSDLASRPFCQRL